MSQAGQEVRFEELIGLPVDGPGGPFAQIEDVRVEPDGEEYVVHSFILGPLGFRAKLDALFWALPTLRALGLGKKNRIRVLPWEMIDLSDPSHPRLRE
jgi:hypothetical protein